MRSDEIVRRARQRTHLTQRELAARANTSPAAVAQYETGVKVPRVDTLERLLRAAGFVPEVSLRPAADRTYQEREAKGRELLEALELAAQFPVRRPAATLPRPVLRGPRGTPR